MSVQKKQSEWEKQWSMLSDESEFLFKEWIQPHKIEDFKGKDVLECGCGGGQHTSFLAPIVKSITAVDLNTIEIAKKRNKSFSNVTFHEHDLTTLELNKTFDIVFCIGVLQHTDFPSDIVKTMKKHLKPGGLLIIWCYSKEGNFLVEHCVEPIRRVFLKKLNKNVLLKISKAITGLMYLPIYSIYLLPLKKLPFYQYFQNFRRLSFERNVLNVFDKLNAPQTIFFDKETATSFTGGLYNALVLPYKGISWRISGRKESV